MVLRDLQGMSRYICQNLPHTGASNITLYTTFINHWVVSPLWDMVGVHELQQMCFEFNSKTIQSHLSSLNKNAAKLKKTQEACRIFPQPLSFTKKTHRFRGKKHTENQKKTPPVNRQVAVDDNGFEERHAIGRIDLIEEDQDLNVATSAIKSALKRHKSMLSYRCLGVKYGKWN